MNVETKKIWIQQFDPNNTGEAVKDAIAFGWEKTDQTVRQGRSTYGLMIRNKDMPHYFEIVELETEYLNLKGKLKRYNKADFTTYLLLFILLVIPFVLFLTFKILQKKHINKHNEPILARMDELKKKAKQLLE